MCLQIIPHPPSLPFSLPNFITHSCIRCALPPQTKQKLYKWGCYIKSPHVPLSKSCRLTCTQHILYSYYEIQLQHLCNAFLPWGDSLQLQQCINYFSTSDSIYAPPPEIKGRGMHLFTRKRLGHGRGVKCEIQFQHLCNAFLPWGGGRGGSHWTI